MKWLLVPFFVFLACLVHAKDTYTCSICKTGDLTQVYVVKGLNDTKKLVCAKCSHAPRCTICRLPMPKAETTQLEDGRIFCNDDYAAGIFDPRETERVLYQTRQEMTRAFWKYMSFPQTNLEVSLVSASELYRLYNRPYNPASVDLEGLTRSTTTMGADGKPVFHHRIFLLSGLPKPRLMATCAHEFAHVFFNEHRQPNRHVDKNTEEGFCELVAYQLMDSLNETLEKQVIEANTYTDDQAMVLIEGEKQYGLYRVIQWMLNGTDSKVSLADLDRLRTDEAPAVASQPAPASPLVASIQILPAELALKGISGSGQRRFALINNATVMANESVKIHLASTNLDVRCLEIRDKSVLVEINGADKQELFLRQ